MGAISPTSFAFFDTKRNELGQKQFWKKVSFKDLKKILQNSGFFQSKCKSIPSLLEFRNWID